MDRPLAEGDEVDGKYRIVRHLGAGGMGHVYEAEDRSLGRRIVLKVLPAALQMDEVARLRLLREGRTAARLRHPGVVRIYEVGSDGQTDYVAMELLEGEDLHTRLRRAGPLPLALVQRLGSELADAMAAMHDAGIIHRDLKPKNLFLAREGGESDVLKVLDFGVAKTVLSRLEAITETGQVLGTLHYMAPEQLRSAKNADERSDIWAAGAILYEALAGHPPFEADTGPELILKIATEPAPSLAELRPDVPAQLVSTIARAMSRSPSERFASAHAFAAAWRATEAAGESEPAILEPGPRADANSLVPVRVPADIGDAPTLRADGKATRLFSARRLTGSLAFVTAAALLGLGVLERGGKSSPPRPAPHDMVWIAGGELAVGKNPDELEAECKAIGTGCDRKLMQREVPRARVEVSPFLLDVHEVTNEELAATLNALSGTLYVVKDEDSQLPRFVRWNKDLGHDGEYLVDLHPAYGGVEYTAERKYRALPGREQLPAVQMSWYGARMHCTLLGKRLPTEDEWEAAARGVDDRRFPWGAAAPRCDGLALARDGLVLPDAHCPEIGGPWPVGKAPQDVTPEGVHDLGGNVAEWVDSTYVEGDRTAHPTDAQGLLPRVIRGGSWGESLMVRTSGRNRRPAGTVGVNVGFRCASGGGSQVTKK